jgi:hypothetical protein
LNVQMAAVLSNGGGAEALFINPAHSGDTFFN